MDLKCFAIAFTGAVGDKVFSAESQGFLVKRKGNPEKAIEEVSAWVQEAHLMGSKPV